MTDINKMRFGPSPWTCTVCGHENAMSVQECQECSREARRTLTDGTQIYPGHREINPATGQQRGYVVLSEDERAKGFQRPVRRSYKHLKCGTVTTMGQSLAETYARDPKFYSGTFCCGCRNHFPIGADGEFVWDGSNEKVGT